MKKTFLMLVLFLASMSFSFAEEVWVRAYMMRDTKHPIHKKEIIPAGLEMKSYGPVERSEVKEMTGCVNILYSSQESYEQGPTREEINQAIADALAQEQTGR